MTKFVSFVPDDAIEKDAQALLAEYAHARGVTIEAPIAIDDIIEKHLKFGIEFDDMHRLFGVPRSGIGFDPDILGAIFFEQKRIVIDESLDPDANPAKEGRYRYTAAHEVGHWRLHRGLLGKDPAQTSLLDANTPSVICRTSQAKARIELQADLYASCVLMPRKLVFAAWDEHSPIASRGASTVRTDRPPLRRDRAPRKPHSRRCLHRKRRSGARKFREALRREVPRFADRHAHPARKARAAAPRCAASSASVMVREPLF